MAARPHLRASTRFAGLAAALLSALVGAPVHAGDAPRVMSLNVCTDQMVLDIAAPGQIVSLSNLSGDPGLSYRHAEAAAYPKNAGLAEEVFVERPDIVVTGTYSLHNTTQLLRRLEITVEEFDYGQTLETIPREIRRMGELLDRKAAAETLATDFERRLEKLHAPENGPRPSLIAYGQNGVVLGSGTLAGSVIKAAGFRNIAAERGVSGMEPYPLEALIADRPDVVLLSAPYEDAPALADLFGRHPAIADLPSKRLTGVVPPGSWSCGGAYTIEALAALRALRDEIVAGGPS